MVDMAALEAQVNEDVAALMLTNPNTLGVFEQDIHKIADMLHAKGALLYMDGANMNALVGKVRPGDFGADVMHLNLHKTFSTPHGGGGPGSGPVACKKILEPFLPTPVVVTQARRHAGLRLRPPAVHRPRAHVLRQLRHVRPRAGLHHGQRPRRPAPDHRRRGAQRQLHSQEAGRRTTICRTSTPTMHEVVFSDELQTAKGVQDRRHRQAADRLRLPSLHRQLPADRARRADDRAHRERVKGRARPVHRRHEVGRRRGERIPRSSSKRRTTRASRGWTKPAAAESRYCAGSRRARRQGSSSRQKTFFTAEARSTRRSFVLDSPCLRAFEANFLRSSPTTPTPAIRPGRVHACAE